MTGAMSGGTIPAQELLVPVGSGQGPLHSVLLHPAGGGLSPYLGVASMLGRLGPVHGIRASGLMKGEQPDDSIEVMAAKYRALLDSLERPPDLLFGWSLGGVLAFELAARALEANRPRVVMLDSPAVPTSSAEELKLQCERMVESAGSLLGGIDRTLVAETTGAHLRALLTHRPRSEYDGSVLLITCDDEDNTEHVRRWKSLSPSLRERAVPGNHFEALTEPYLSVVLEHLGEFLTDTRFSDDAPGTPSCPRATQQPTEYS